MIKLIKKGKGYTIFEIDANIDDIIDPEYYNNISEKIIKKLFKKAKKVLKSNDLCDCWGGIKGLKGKTVKLEVEIFSEKDIQGGFRK